MAGVGSLRRSVGGAFGALALVAAMGVGPAGAQSSGEGLIPEGDWTDEQVAELLDLIDRTEAELPARFPTVATYDQLADVLGGMGFFNFGATAPGGYDHWINPGWVVDDRVVDPEVPESLVYQIQGDGNWHLVSAMFMLHPAITMHSIPEDIGWLPGWHGHPELCTNPDGTFAGITDPDDPSCPEGTQSAATPLMMHVWIVNNACGHRFGGVGVQGLHCDVMHHGGDPGSEPTTTSTTTTPTTTTTTTTTTTPTTQPPGTTPPVAPPAQPVVAQPTFTG